MGLSMAVGRDNKKFSWKMRNSQSFDKKKEGKIGPAVTGNQLQ